MPSFINFSRIFNLTALRANGTGIGGAQIRILNALGTDVTSGYFNNPLDSTDLFGSPLAHTTDSGGVFVRSILMTNLTPAGVHTIQVIAPGYELWQLVTPGTFNGSGTYVANLIRVNAVVGAYSINSPSSGYVSALYPIVYSVDTPANDYAWELIRFRLTHLDTRTGVLEAPVDPATANASADLHSRVRLRPRPPSGTRQSGVNHRPRLFGLRHAVG